MSYQWVTVVFTVEKARSKEISWQFISTCSTILQKSTFTNLSRSIGIMPLLTLTVTLWLKGISGTTHGGIEFL